MQIITKPLNLMFAIVRRVVADNRVRRGYCPLCNSDAPEVDTCPVCKGSREYRPSQITKFCWMMEWNRCTDYGRHKFKLPEIESCK